MSELAEPSRGKLVEAMLTLLEEAYQGSNPSFFSDSDKGGVLGALEGISAGEASQAPTSSPTTLAAQAEHLRWSLANVNAVTAGGEWNPNWSESWRVHSVSPEEWDELRARLRREYQRLRRSVEANRDWSDSTILTGMIATVAHAAYHLGAIRQMLKIKSVTARAAVSLVDIRGIPRGPFSARPRSSWKGRRR